MSAAAGVDPFLDDTWALVPAVLRQVRAYLAGDASLRAAISRTPSAPRTQGVVAVIPIEGVIERRSSLMGELFGGTSLETLRAQLRAAVADPEVRGIILNIDSPGGGVAGVTELASEIRDLRTQKPIVALADTVAGSAAYWLGSQASRFIITPSGQVGSIGVFGVHLDTSRQLEAEGVTATVIAAGEHKTDESEFAPLTDEARARIQARTNAFYAQFVGDVAKGRGVSSDTVRSDYGKGGVLLAQDALAAGMVDGIGTIDQALREVTRMARQLAAEGELVELEASDEPVPFRAQVAALRADTEAVVAHAQARAALRSKEGRPPLSEPILASLRATRDAINELLLVEPAAGEPPAADPPPVVPEAAAAAPAIPRIRNDADWVQFLEGATA